MKIRPPRRFSRKSKERKDSDQPWENYLVEEIKRTNLLKDVDHQNLLFLQKQRHFSAHAVLNDNLELHRPNHDTVRALIRNTIDDVLTKAPFLATDITDHLVKAIEKFSAISSEVNALRVFLEDKYYKKFIPKVGQEVFKALWKFVFRLTDDPCTKNREINYKALCILYERNPTQFNTQIENDKDHFSQVSMKEPPIYYLIFFLSSYKTDNLYNLLAESTQIIIRKVAEEDPAWRCMAWFIHKDFTEHMNSLKSWIGTRPFIAKKIGSHLNLTENIRIDMEHWKIIKTLSDSPEWGKMFISLVNDYYLSSGSEDVAEERFDDAISPNLQYYEEVDDLIYFITKIYASDIKSKEYKCFIEHVVLLTRRLWMLDPEAIKRL